MRHCHYMHHLLCHLFRRALKQQDVSPFVNVFIHRRPRHPATFAPTQQHGDHTVLRRPVSIFLGIGLVNINIIKYSTLLALFPQAWGSPMHLKKILIKYF